MAAGLPFACDDGSLVLLVVYLFDVLRLHIVDDYISILRAAHYVPRVGRNAETARVRGACVELMLEFLHLLVHSDIGHPDRVVPLRKLCELLFLTFLSKRCTFRPE